MKSIALFLTAILMTLASCSQQHVCPTYSNSGIKYHNHQPHAVRH